MIGEKYFINNYSFFWESHLPMTNFFLRKMNTDLFEKQDEFLESKTNGRRRSLLSQVGFEIFGEAVRNKADIDSALVEDRFKEIEEKCRVQLLELEDEDITHLLKKLDEYEINESVELAKRLDKYFSTHENLQEIIINPRFKGCGFIDFCYGDIVANNTLYEIKMVDRNFRSIDCRQLLTYCALNYMSNDYTIKNIGIYNPRRGKYFKISLDRFTLMISGKPSSVLLGEIIEFISGGGVSK